MILLDMMYDFLNDLNFVLNLYLLVVLIFKTTKLVPQFNNHNILGKLWLKHFMQNLFKEFRYSQEFYIKS